LPPTEGSPEFFTVWAKALGDLTHGLKLDDQQDRVTFRFEVATRLRNLPSSGMRQLIAKLGAKVRESSRSGLSSAIAEAYLQGKRL